MGFIGAALLLLLLMKKIYADRPNAQLKDVNYGCVNTQHLAYRFSFCENYAH